MPPPAPVTMAHLVLELSLMFSSNVDLLHGFWPNPDERKSTLGRCHGARVAMTLIQ